MDGTWRHQSLSEKQSSYKSTSAGKEIRCILICVHAEYDPISLWISRVASSTYTPLIWYMPTSKGSVYTCEDQSLPADCRDESQANVLIDDEKRALLTDFGLATVAYELNTVNSTSSISKGGGTVR